jgi:hypothetical protein
MSRMSAVALSCALLASSPAVAAPRASGSYDARWIVAQGKGTKEVKAVLILEEDGVALRSRSGELLRSLPYASLDTVTHSTTRHRRWVSGLAVGALVSPVGLALALTKSTRHYVTFAQGESATVVKLDGDDYADALMRLQPRLPQPLVLASR